MKIIKMILVVVLIMLTSLTYSQTIDRLYEVATWPGFRQGAVSFTFDDNCANQLSVVMPIFDQYGFKMTFFTVVNWGPNWNALQTAASNGHEVASHTLTHANFGTLTNEQQITELKNSQDAINSHIRGQKCLTIAYPNCVVGNSAICSQYYVAARGCSGVIVPKTPPDFMNISSVVCGSQGSVQRAGDFQTKMDGAASSNGWIVFLIHAIDNESGYSPTSSSEIKNTLEYISKNDNKLWESTFSNVARYIKERNNVSVTELNVNDSLITAKVTDTLDNTIYNYPVTIRRVLPEGWPSASIIQNGKIISSQIIKVNSDNYIMFDVEPDGGDIQIIKDDVSGIIKNLKSQITSPYLMQNYPNPFNPSTRIEYSLPKSGYVSLKIYNSLGQQEAVLFNGFQHAGNFAEIFNGENLTSGVYLYQLCVNDYVKTKKLILIK